MPSIAFIPKRLNEPPVVFRGMTGKEVVMMTVAGFVSGLPLGIVSAWVLGAIAMVPTVCFLFAGAALWFGGTVMRRLRRGRSTIWFYRHVQWKLACAGLPMGDAGSLITDSTAYRIRRDSYRYGARS